MPHSTTTFPPTCRRNAHSLRTRLRRYFTMEVHLYFSEAPCSMNGGAPFLTRKVTSNTIKSHPEEKSRGPSIQKCQFSKEGWHSDGFGLNNLAIQKLIYQSSGNLIPLSCNASTVVLIVNRGWIFIWFLAVAGHLWYIHHNYLSILRVFLVHEVLQWMVKPNRHIFMAFWHGQPKTHFYCNK